MPPSDARDRQINPSVKTSKGLSGAESQQVVSYLTDPTQVGVWKLEARWLFDQGISQDIKDTIDQKETDGFKISSSTQGRNNIRLPKGYIDQMLETSEKITFLFKLFKWITEEDSGGTRREYFSPNDDEFLISNLDLSDFATKYKKALKNYKDEIYFSGFEPLVTDRLVTIKSGSFLVTVGPMELKENNPGPLGETSLEKTKIEIQAIGLEPLKKVSKFLELVGKIDDCEIYKIFSPEEELLTPYVEYARIMLLHIVKSDGIYRLFHKMISDYDDENFSSAIGAAGQIGEECLTQIYETLHRQPVKQNMPLGELRDSIARIVKHKSVSHDKKPLTKQEVMKLINSRKINEKNIQRIVAANSKTIIDSISDNNKRIEFRLRALEGLDKTANIYPHIIKLNLNGLIRLRNAVSHKSSDPIGSTQALKSIYYSLSIYIWWETERRAIDWEKTEKDIINQFVYDAQHYGA